MNRLARTAVAAAVLGCVGSALAERVDLFVYENNDGVSTIHLDLWVDVVLVESGNAVDFTFHNDSTSSAIVTAIYFEDAGPASDFVSAFIAFESAGVDFSDGAIPNNPAQPGINFGGDWDGNFYSLDSNPPPTANGIGHGGTETLTVRVDIGALSFQDVLDGLAGDEPSWRIAQHVQSVGDGASSVWTTSVPAPGAALGLLAGSACLIRRRR